MENENCQIDWDDWQEIPTIGMLANPNNKLCIVNISLITDIQEALLLVIRIAKVKSSQHGHLEIATR